MQVIEGPRHRKPDQKRRRPGWKTVAGATVVLAAVAAIPFLPERGGAEQQTQVPLRAAAPEPPADPGTPTPTPAPSPRVMAPAVPQPRSARKAAPRTTQPSAKITPGIVPDVTGLSVARASEQLSAAGYGYAVVCENGPVRDAVRSQQPPAGRRWTPGAEVALFVRRGNCP